MYGEGKFDEKLIETAHKDRIYKWHFVYAGYDKLNNKAVGHIKFFDSEEFV